MISVIIPAKDACKTLDECMRAVLIQGGLASGADYEVIVVDDGSSDDSAKIAQEFAVKVIRQANRGPAAARNAGAKIAKGSIIVFTDADCVPSPSWLKDITHAFQDPTVVGVKGVYRTHQTELVARFVQLEYEYKYARMRKQAFIDFVDTYNAAYRRDVFMQNGGFDEAYRTPSVEDQEFSFRLARKGYRMVFEPAAVVRHTHDRNLSEYLERKFGIGYWKAFMLRSIPEKTFSDSHTAPTQRIEILLLALLITDLPFIAIWPTYASIFFLFVLAIFVVTISPFLRFVGQHDRNVLWIAPSLLIARAGALGFGLLKGFILPPEVEPNGAE